MKSKTSVKASVLIPIRNEELTIKATIESVLNNADQSVLSEIIVINDHSTDHSVNIIETIDSITPLRIVSLSEGQKGKKAALTVGVELAESELIICTDGDTLVGKNWINSHVDSYQNGAKLSFASVVYGDCNRVSKCLLSLLNMELLTLVGIGGSTISAGKASMINGCNYSFAKSVFLEVNGFEGNEHIASGDDEFLLRKVHASYPDSVNFLKTPRAIVETTPPDSFYHFVQQRIRWASKWRLHKELFSKMVPLLVFLLNICFVVIYFEFFLKFDLLIILCTVIKFFSDWIFICNIYRVYNYKVSISVFLVMQMIYPIYVVLFGIGSTFGRYRWQGRSY